jgi:salicylate hydroxylase
MTKQVLIAGGGIGGLAAALACSRAGWGVRVFERAAEFSEVGAGIQIGPNVVRVLQSFGLDAALTRVAAFPERLQVRNAISGNELGVLPLGERSVRLYGAPYATIHRADLHHLLLESLQQRSDVQLSLGCWLASYTETPQTVTLSTTDGLDVEGDMLIGADGLWSRVRELMLNDGAPRVPGHLAYRAMLPQHSLPEQLRSQQVTAWLGPRMHVVQYPVRGGDWLNVVAIVQGHVEGDLQSWDHSANAADLRAALSHGCAPLRDLIEAIPDWRLWTLCDRPPMQGAWQQAHGLVALLGDAAHPMRPYLAQGAGMAIEDADELGRTLSMPDIGNAERLQRYALKRWERCACVQARSIRNGEIFHAGGLIRWGRDTGLKLLGERVLDVPWLYKGAK